MFVLRLNISNLEWFLEYSFMKILLPSTPKILYQMFSVLIVGKSVSFIIVFP